MIKYLIPIQVHGALKRQLASQPAEVNSAAALWAPQCERSGHFRKDLESWSFSASF